MSGTFGFGKGTYGPLKIKFFCDGATEIEPEVIISSNEMQGSVFPIVSTHGNGRLRSKNGDPKTAFPGMTLVPVVRHGIKNEAFGAPLSAIARRVNFASHQTNQLH
jgi:hypothetical protein